MTSALLSLHSSPPLLCSRLSTLPKTLKPFLSLRHRGLHLRFNLSVAAGDDGGDGDLDGPDLLGGNFFEDEQEDADNEEDYDVEYDKLLTGRDREGTGEDEELEPVSSEGFISTLGREPETVVNYKINEEEFHKISLLDCDFFIRKPPDPDDNVYDFREMYFSSPDTDVYSIPRVLAPMPKKYIRCAMRTYGLYNTTEPPVDFPRDPLYKIDREIFKVFLTKHYRNRRESDAEFMLDFEEIYVIDSETKSITRAKVTVVAPGGKERDRRNDLLIIRDGGTSFKIIDQDERDDAQTVIEKEDWAETRDEMVGYLRKFQDFEESNWF